MGCGKSTIGKILAAREGWQFVDLDSEIERRAKKPIVQIFEEQGESKFRELENQALLSLKNKEHLVLACGGGLITIPKNVSFLRKHFHVVYLKLSIEDLKKRLVKSMGRPLIAVTEPEKQIEELFNYRRQLYLNAAHQIFNPDPHLGAEKNADSLLGILSRDGLIFSPRQIGVNLPSSFYRILIGHRLLGKTGRLLKELKENFSILAIVTNPVINQHWSNQLCQSLEMADQEWIKMVIPAGERYKNLKTAKRIWDWLINSGVDRHGCLIALGGGVVGDLVGFAASTYLRGIAYLQIPTTLLALVDSSIGGKTAIDLPNGKNLVGSFYQPRLVVGDLDVLNTLPTKEVKNGLAEIIKYGFLIGQPLLSTIEQALRFKKFLKADQLEEIVFKCAAFKAKVVEEDETDLGRRAILNYGHTIGHALEAASKYKNYTHGQAIAIGMLGAAMLANDLGILKKEVLIQHQDMLAKAGLPTRFDQASVDSIIEAMMSDKKRKAGNIRFVLLSDLGKPELVEVDIPLISKVLQKLNKSY